jgi:hypothetical protein
MNEKLQPPNQEQNDIEMRLWNELSSEKQKTDDARSASKALNLFADLTGVADYIVGGKANPIITVSGIAAITLTPFILDKLDQPTWSLISSDIFAGIGFAALGERELPFFSGSEKAIDKWVSSWILNTKKSRIEGGDIARVLVNFPKVLPKNPEEIRGQLTEADDVKKEKDAYVSVAKLVRGIIVEEHFAEEKYGPLSPEDKKAVEIDETVLLMMKAQIIAQEKMRDEKYIRKECRRIASDVFFGAVIGVIVSEASSRLFGSQYGVLFGLTDDAYILGTNIKNKIARAMNKNKSNNNDSKDSARFKSMQEKQEKIRSFFNKYK